MAGLEKGRRTGDGSGRGRRSRRPCRNMPHRIRTTDRELHQRAVRPARLAHPARMPADRAPERLAARAVAVRNDAHAQRERVVRLRARAGRQRSDRHAAGHDGGETPPLHSRSCRSPARVAPARRDQWPRPPFGDCTCSHRLMHAGSSMHCVEQSCVRVRFLSHLASRSHFMGSSRAAFWRLLQATSDARSVSARSCFIAPSAPPRAGACARPGAAPSGTCRSPAPRSSSSPGARRTDLCPAADP